ncbi:alpha/beta hydrolase [Virgibacillus sp. NKC19-3]|uniref:alpha/beta fold hydrolase n=1 Tax=Virgibacillus saliphilus TaxID=2831674 RepID=UPI001C9B35FC|nr:alpha/beta hydrolase [Virgibacillus sp. NKC19-3]MBY7144533.1 alpha/beta hydrolase [Virgibacillus sp. NKC19-3]
MAFYKKIINGKMIQVTDYPGKKDPIIAIHGLTGTYKNMHYYAEKFKGDYRFIAVDLRGRGNSDALDANPSIFKHADDIIGLVEVLAIGNPILMGHSMGAFISAIFASKMDSVKGVILLDGAAKMSERQRDIVKPSLERLSKLYVSKEQYVGEIKDIYLNLGITWSEPLKNAVEYEVEQVGNHWENKSNQAAINADFESFYTFNPEQVCSQIYCPMLLVYAEGNIGSMSPLFYLKDYNETRKYTKQLETVISDCNHYTMVSEKRDYINREIDSFLKRRVS